MRRGATTRLLGGEGGGRGVVSDDYSDKECTRCVAPMLTTESSGAGTAKLARLLGS